MATLVYRGFGKWMNNVSYIFFPSFIIISPVWVEGTRYARSICLDCVLLWLDFEWSSPQAKPSFARIWTAASSVRTSSSRTCNEYGRPHLRVAIQVSKCRATENENNNNNHKNRSRASIRLTLLWKFAELLSDKNRNRERRCGALTQYLLWILCQSKTVTDAFLMWLIRRIFVPQFTSKSWYRRRRLLRQIFGRNEIQMIFKQFLSILWICEQSQWGEETTGIDLRWVCGQTAIIQCIL